ncbi:MAG: fused signal recognition particle receptor, partial [Nocardioidaceae bacterium]|nr:fused signal recognition particle receptor [Nocardioidaceae bacterium]
MPTIVLFLIIAVVVVVLGVGASLLVGRGRKPLPPVDEVDSITTETIKHPEHPEPHLAEDDVAVVSPPIAEPVVPVEAPIVERPEAPQGRLVRLRARLARSQGSLGKGLLTVLGRATLDDAAWEEIEDTLLAADVGVGPTDELVAALKTRMRVEGVKDPDHARTVLREELVAVINPSLDRSLSSAGADGKPGVILVVGVNGTGKTTTVGRLARVLVAEDKSIVLGAADTFRAAAA